MKRFFQWILILLLFCGTASSLLAKSTVEDQQERLLLIFTLLQDERLLAAPGVHPNGFKAGLDMSFVPPIDTTVGTKDENVNFSPVILRPTVRYDSFDLLFFHVGAIPKVKISNFTIQTVSTKLGVGFDTGLGNFSLWGSYTNGELIAPITEPRLPSEDEMTFTISGAGLAYGLDLGDYAPYFATEYRDLEGELFIPEDKTTIKTTYDGPTYGLGLVYRAWDPILLTLEEIHVPGILTNPRFSFVYQF